MGSGKAAAMALRAPRSGIQIQDNKHTRTSNGALGGFKKSLVLVIPNPTNAKA